MKKTNNNNNNNCELMLSSFLLYTYNHRDDSHFVGLINYQELPLSPRLDTMSRTKEISMFGFGNS